MTEKQVISGITGRDCSSVMAPSHCQQVKGWTPNQSRSNWKGEGIMGKKRVLKQSGICQGRRAMKTVQRNEHRISAGTVPPDAALREYYGAVGRELSATTARTSMMYDIVNDIIADAKIEPLTADERTQVKEHLEKPGGPEFEGRKPVVIFDRGYPSKDLIRYLQDREIKYVMRVFKEGLIPI
jgi:hypothetical protein